VGLVAIRINAYDPTRKGTDAHHAAHAEVCRPNCRRDQYCRDRCYECGGWSLDLGANDLGLIGKAIGRGPRGWTEEAVPANNSVAVGHIELVDGDR